MHETRDTLRLCCAIRLRECDHANDPRARHLRVRTETFRVAHELFGNARFNARQMNADLCNEIKQAIDGIAMEELFFLATDKPCTEDWCSENLADTRALRDAGKFVLSVDYATRPADAVRDRHYV